MPDLTFHHLGVAVASIEKALPTYTNLLGYTLRDGPYTDPIQKVSVCFLHKPGTQDPLIELIAPADKDAPINKYLAKEVGAYHHCYETPNLAAAIDHLRSNGALHLSGPDPAVAFGGRPIAWLFLPTRHLIEIIEREQR